MKKNNQSGFVLAETLVVTVFIMVIFSMIYSQFYPLIGEYEKRETYDDVEGKYAVFWLKRMIEDSSYDLEPLPDTAPLADRNRRTNQITNFQTRGYVRFECRDVSYENDKQLTCRNLVKALEIEGCDANGNGCEIYLTKYRLGDTADIREVYFKDTVKNNLVRSSENCFKPENECREDFITECKGSDNSTVTQNKCERKADKNTFRSGFQDYLVALPDYSAASLNYAKYRVIASFHHKKDNNNYYSYATIEVRR